MSWKKTRIGDFLKRSKIPIDIEDGKDYKRVTIRIKHNGISIRDVARGKKIGTKKQFILKGGQFLMSKIDARYGAFGIAPNEVEGAIITGNFWAYDVDKEKLNIEWFNQYTNSPDFYELCERASSGITHRKYLDEKFFLNYEIDLPDAYEQLNIIERIKQQKMLFGSLSAELTHQRDLVTQLRQAFLREAMQGKLTPQDPNDEPANVLLKKIKAEKEQLIKLGKIKKQKELPPIEPEEIPFEIPENWVWCRLGELRDFEYTLSYGVLVPGNDQPNGVPFVRVQDLDFAHQNELPNKRISQEISSQYSRTILKGGEILICVVGSIGKVALVPNSWVGANIARAVCRLMPNQQISKKYLFACLNSHYVQNLFLSGKKSINPTLNVGILETTPIPLPSLSEQNRIVAKLEQLMTYCDQLEQSIKQSQAQNEQLLQQVLREALQPKEVDYAV